MASATSMTQASPRSARPGTRWRLALAGFLIGVVGMTALTLAGVEFRRGERDFTLAVAVAIELAFGIWGFLLGRSVEARARVDELTGLQARVAELEKPALLGQLAGSIAHEIRNPLAIIRTMVQNLAEAEPEGRAGRERACTQLLEEVDRLTRVTDSLVGLSRPVRPQWTLVDSRQLIERVTWLATRMTGTGVSLRARAHAPAARVRADPDLLCQLLLGLVTNAAQAAGGGVIDLDCHVADRHVIFAVTDSGPGVPAALRERIFEPFFTTRPGGSGLGLAVARRIVEAHGGHISVEDAPGRGARFVVRLEAAPS